MVGFLVWVPTATTCRTRPPLLRLRSPPRLRPPRPRSIPNSRLSSRRWALAPGSPSPPTPSRPSKRATPPLARGRQLRFFARTGSELRVPGPAGAPDVTLVSARPARATGPLPLLYYMHGGAMIMGSAWSVLPRVPAGLGPPPRPRGRLHRVPARTAGALPPPDPRLPRFPRPTSTSGRPRCSGTRPWRTRTPSGRPAAPPTPRVAGGVPRIRQPRPERRAHPRRARGPHPLAVPHRAGLPASSPAVDQPDARLPHGPRAARSRRAGQTAGPRAGAARNRPARSTRRA
jgi:hypothetical protein